MPAFICPTCGTQYAPSDQPPATCAICSEERQYVPATGQTWTTLEAMGPRYDNCFHLYEPNLFGIRTVPHFGIGQRALLVRAPGGNILWDCIAYLDGGTVEIVKALGGVSAIAISHPHFYTTMVEWSRAFGDAPIHLHADDRQWIMRPDSAIKLWDGDTLPLGDGLTLIRCGGHFAGGTVLHWAAGAGGRGALLSGDIVAVRPGARLRELHAQLSQPPPAVSARGRAHRQDARALSVRSDLRRDSTTAASRRTARRCSSDRSSATCCSARRRLGRAAVSDGVRASGCNVLRGDAGGDRSRPSSEIPASKRQRKE